jgi:hypothetical protein
VERAAYWVTVMEERRRRHERLQWESENADVIAREKARANVKLTEGELGPCMVMRQKGVARGLWGCGRERAVYEKYTSYEFKMEVDGVEHFFDTVCVFVCVLGCVHASVLRWYLHGMEGADV